MVWGTELCILFIPLGRSHDCFHTSTDISGHHSLITTTTTTNVDLILHVHTRHRFLTVLKHVHDAKRRTRDADTVPKSQKHDAAIRTRRQQQRGP